MHMLIIGGTRFVGYQLVWRLLAAGHHVTILNRGSRPDPFGDRVERLIADRTTPEFARVLAGRRFDAVVDFAAYTAADARDVVTILGEGRVGHYVFISTGQVYLVRKGCPWPAKESDYDGPLMPEPSDSDDHENWIHGVQKREAEDVLTAAWEATRFPVTRLRIPVVNGERDHFRRIESYLWRILNGGPVLLPDGGTHTIRHVYSGDVVKTICTLLDNTTTFGQAYNLSQDETPTLTELVAILAELVGAPTRLASVPTATILAAGLRPIDLSPFSDLWMSRLDARKAKAELGFRPEPLHSYLEKIVTAFLNHPPASPPENYANRAAELRLVGVCVNEQESAHQQKSVSASQAVKDTVHALKATAPVLTNQLVTLEPADEQNVELLIQWTLDPVAQGPYKRVPAMTGDELRDLFLHSPDRRYFLIRRTSDGKPLGRFYYRAWRFGGEADGIDWELNILLADPGERGKGYGTATQQLAADSLLARPDTRSIFAYTAVGNTAERRALQKAGFAEVGLLPHAYYHVELPPHPCVLHARQKQA